jgi:periplasmic divalent cation tolerance protein
MSGRAVVLTTCESEEQASRIARLLVERKSAACVNITGPIRSVYRWQGAVEEAGEYLLIVKTEQALSDDVRRTIEEAHSYEVPEVIVLPIVGGSERYLAWISESVIRQDPGPAR